nr:PREDICTED: probable DNA helicase MCM9 [Musa acuminata subsp. malaccensis]
MAGPNDVEDEQQQIGAFARFLISHHAPLLRSIVLSPDSNLHYPLLVDFAELLDFDPSLAHLFFSRPSHLLPLFDEAARRCQDVILENPDDLGHTASKKYHVHVRINVGGSPLESPGLIFAIALFI